MTDCRCSRHLPRPTTMGAAIPKVERPGCTRGHAISSTRAPQTSRRRSTWKRRTVTRTTPDTNCPRAMSSRAMSSRVSPRRASPKSTEISAQQPCLLRERRRLECRTLLEFVIRDVPVGPTVLRLKVTGTASELHRVTAGGMREEPLGIADTEPDTAMADVGQALGTLCLLYTSPSPRDR